MKTFLLFLTVLLFSLSVYSQDISGRWSGVLEVSGRKIPLSFNIVKDEDKFSAIMETISKDLSNKTVIPVNFETPKLKFQMDEFGAEFVGELEQDNKMNGTYTQNGTTYSVTLMKQEKGLLNGLLSWSLSLKPYLEVLSALVVLIGLPLGIWQYIRQKSYETYDAVGNEFLEYLKVCFDNPELDIFEIDNDDPIFKSDSTNDSFDTNKKKEFIGYEMLIAVFERAYLMYGGHTSLNPMKKRQWKGWEKYIELFCKKPKFRKVWEKWIDDNSTWDEKFEKVMQEKLDDQIAKEQKNNCQQSFEESNNSEEKAKTD